MTHNSFISDSSYSRSNLALLRRERNLVRRINEVEESVKAHIAYLARITAQIPVIEFLDQGPSSEEERSIIDASNLYGQVEEWRSILGDKKYKLDRLNQEHARVKFMIENNS